MWPSRVLRLQEVFGSNATALKRWQCQKKIGVLVIRPRRIRQKYLIVTRLLESFFSGKPWRIVFKTILKKTIMAQLYLSSEKQLQSISLSFITKTPGSCTAMTAVLCFNGHLF